MARLLVVHHSPTPAVRRLTDAVLAGAADPELSGVTVLDRPALEASADDVLGADGLVLVTPANFGYMSGALKHFFDSVFLEVGGALSDDGGAQGGRTAAGRTPYGLVVHGRYDTAGATRAVLAIAGALPWRQGAEVLEVLGDVEEPDAASAYEVGATIAALASG